jgi:glycosyltransferase involved in cell wall biosynthesis
LEIGGGSDTFAISVVVCVYNGEKHISSCLESLRSQTLPRHMYEVVVVDDGSTDQTGEILRRNCWIDRVVVHPHNRGLGPARNTGVAAANGVLVAFTDADCTAYPDWLEQLVQRFISEKEVAGVGGRVEPAPSTSVWGRWYAYTPGTAGAHQPMSRDSSGVERVLRALRLVRGRLVQDGEPLAVILGANSAYRRDVIQALGGWSAEIRFGGDDVEFSRRVVSADFLQVYDASAVIVHHYRDSFAAFVRHAWAYGAGNGRLSRLLGGSAWRAVGTDLLPLAPFGVWAVVMRTYRPILLAPLLFILLAAPRSIRYASKNRVPMCAVVLPVADLCWRGAHSAGHLWALFSSGYCGPAERRLLP